jgi:hypothetical protein
MIFPPHWLDFVSPISIQLSRELEAVGKELDKEGQLAAQSVEKHEDPNKANAVRSVLVSVAQEIPEVAGGARSGRDISGALNRLLDALNKLRDLTVGQDEANEQELEAKLLKDDLARLEQAVDEGSVRLLISENPKFLLLSLFRFSESSSTSPTHCSEEGQT